MGQPDEFPQGFARLVGAQAVQVELALDAPVSGAQPVRHVGADAGTPEAELVVHVQQRAHVEFVADRFMEHALLVEFALHGLRLGGLGHMPAALLRAAQGLHRTDRVLEEHALGPRAARGLLPLAQQPGLALGGLGQRLAQRLQILEGAGFHGHGMPVVSDLPARPRRRAE